MIRQVGKPHLSLFKSVGTPEPSTVQPRLFVQSFRQPQSERQIYNSNERAIIEGTTGMPLLIKSSM